MKKNVKEIREFIAEKAKQIPPQYVMVKQGIALTGDQLIEMHKKAGMKPVDKNGAEFEPEKTYHSSQEVPQAVDHFRRMWRLFKKHGPERAFDYAKECMLLEHEASEIKTIGGVPLMRG
jgi:hypothetical protein